MLARSTYLYIFETQAVGFVELPNRTCLKTPLSLFRIVWRFDMNPGTSSRGTAHTERFISSGLIYRIPMS